MNQETEKVDLAFVLLCSGRFGVAKTIFSQERPYLSQEGKKKATLFSSTHAFAILLGCFLITSLKFS